MRKKTILCSAFALLCVAVVHADDATKAYVSVQQDGTKVDAVGMAAYDLSNSPTLEFDSDGNAVITVGGNTVAQLPMSNGGEMVIDFSSTSDNTLSKAVGTSGYATLYSPFQLTVPSGSDVEVYAPTYESPMLKLNDDTKVAAGAIIPVGTGLILKNNGTINFTFSDGAATDTHTSALSGSALTIAKPVEDGKTVYTLGHESTTNEYGFFAYSGENMNPGFAYLLTTTLSDSQKAKYVSFGFDDEMPTAIYQLSSNNSQSKNGKFIKNGRVIIVKNGQKYNLNGQALNEN